MIKCEEETKKSKTFKISHFLSLKLFIYNNFSLFFFSISSLLVGPKTFHKHKVFFRLLSLALKHSEISFSTSLSRLPNEGLVNFLISLFLVFLVGINYIRCLFVC